MNEHSFKNVRGKLVLVTGASSGIGEAVARAVARHGARVVMTARRSQELSRISADIRRSGGRAEWIAADLTDDDDRLRLLSDIQSRFGTVEILISNAGGGWYGPLGEMSWHSVRSLIELNVVATVRLVHALLPLMVRAGHGHLIVIGSIAGNLAAQGIAIYAATKAFLNSFCRSIYRETRRTGVAVSVIRPGAVKTPFFASARHDGGRRIPLSGYGITPQRVANAVVRVTRWRRRVVSVPGYLRIVPVVEAMFGWVLDWLGPISLRRESATQDG